MEITEVRIKLSDEPSERLLAYCSVTFDFCFVIRDLKIIGGSSSPFVAMPSRKLAAHCPFCRMKNHLRSNYCNQCGHKLPTDRIVKDAEGRAKLYADIAHPINQQCRELIQEKVVAEYYLELERAKLPGYVSRYDDFDYDDTAPAKQRPNPPHYQKPVPAKSPAANKAVTPHTIVPPLHQPVVVQQPTTQTYDRSHSEPRITPPLEIPHVRDELKDTGNLNHVEKPEFGSGIF